MARGHWELKAEMLDDSDITDIDRQYIAELIVHGHTSGELIHEEAVNE